MGSQALAVKYRPHDWESLVEQNNIKIILLQQLSMNEIKHAYLFVGGAGTGKTTTARIFANGINKGQGNPIELDAASNNSVDDMRELIKQAQTKSLNSEYKCFIIDECHMITTAGWNAILKLIEEPPAKSIFIFCTTDPQKIPKTIISRVQRFDFQRISLDGIIDRLHYILQEEGFGLGSKVEDEALEYIAKIADGGMRDAITLMDKCLSYTTNLTLTDTIRVLGTTDYATMINLTDSIIDQKTKEMITIVEDIYASGKDVKQFVKQYIQFLLDVSKYAVGCDWYLLNMPKLQDYENWLKALGNYEFKVCRSLLSTMINLNSDIKYSSTPKFDLEAVLMLECEVQE